MALLKQNGTINGGISIRVSGGFESSQIRPKKVMYLSKDVTLRRLCKSVILPAF